MKNDNSTAILNLFKNNTEVKSFAAGETIFEEGQEGDVMYVIQSGEIDIIVQNRVINTHEAGAGEIFGEMAIIDTKIRSATAIAKTDCKLVTIN